MIRMCGFCDTLHALYVLIGKEILDFVVPRDGGWRQMAKSTIVRFRIALYFEIIELNVGHIFDDIPHGSSGVHP